MNKNVNILKKHKELIIEYCALFLIMLILNRAEILGFKVLFAAPFAFSLIYLEKNSFLISLSFFISYILFNLSLEGFVVSLNVISALILLSLIFKVLNKKINFVSTLLFSLLGQVGYIYFHISNPAEIVITIAIVVVSLMFLYISSQAFNAVFFRGLQSKFTLDENICFSIFLIALFTGLGKIYFLNINFTNIIVFILILFTSRIFQKTSVLYMSALMGFGVSFSLGTVVYIASFVSYAILAISLRENHKILAPIGIILLDLVFGLFLNTYPYYSYLNFLSYVIVSVLYLIIPNKIFEKLKGYSYSYQGSLAEEYIISGQKILLKNKLIKLSELFIQMQNAYRNLSMGELDREKVVSVLSEDLTEKCCKSCSNYYNCEQNELIKKAKTQLFDFGLEKGKINIIDANNLLTMKCGKLPALINEANNGLENFFSFEKSMKNEDESKMVIADQLGGTSDILNELSDFVVGGEHVNYNESKKVQEELTLNNIVVNEALVLENESGIEKIILIVRNLDVLSDKIKICLKTLFRINFSMNVCSMTKYAGWSVLCFVPASKYDVSVGFACSSVSPENISGDNHSFEKLNDDKLLFAISDGMGHGKRANEISTISLNLIESFYKSGFSSKTIISCINKILLPVGEENFATLDACVFDKKNGTADFIKIGASCSIIKSKDTSRIIAQESLPLGIIEKVKFNVKKCVLNDQDIVIIASDGVVDCFDNEQDFLNYVNNERVINVQMLVNNILEEAESRSQKHNDDKTIIAFKVNAKI